MVNYTLLLIATLLLSDTGAVNMTDNENNNKNDGFFSSIGRGLKKVVNQPIGDSISYIGSKIAGKDTETDITDSKNNTNNKGTKKEFVDKPIEENLSYIGSDADGKVKKINKNDTNSVKEFFDNVGEGIQKEIVAIKQPIVESIAYIGSVECAEVKKILGVTYEHIEGDVEPDLEELTLEYIDRAIRISYKIGSAAVEIPRSRNFDPHRKLIIFVHGFATGPTESGFGNVSTALIDSGEQNVIALDGTSFIKWLYVRATTYVRFMGEKLGQVLANMVERGLKPENIHIIGHSLGAHISGFIGKTFTKFTGKQVRRISGLDPAGPCFSHVEPDLRLKATDAQFVDVIHTDAGVLGLEEPIGHVDFYPNGGSEQPNCLLQTCSHSRGWLYYAWSVLRPDAFPAVKCKDWDAFKKGQCDQSPRNMGYTCRPDTRGLYFLQTGGEPPYGLGDKGLKYQNTDGILKNITHLITDS